MSNTNKVMLASGIVLGVGAIYASQNKISYDTVLEKFDLNPETFNELVTELVKLALDTLKKIFDWIVEVVRKIVFEVKLLIS